MNPTNFPISKRYHGHVIVTDQSSGVAVEGHNDCPYQAGDILCGLAAGFANYRISHAYFEYQNTAGGTTPAAFALTDTAISRQAVVSPYDLIRAPLIAQPVLSATDVHHAANQAVFTALSNAAVGLNGLTFSAGANSKVISLCLVSATGGSNPLLDLLYARFVLGSALPVSGSGLISVSWPTTWA
jgi:hypothetical protein